jgi:hypothetical protein
MIVRKQDGSLLLIRQPDHAALAGRVMTAWRADGLPARSSRDLVLLATTEHDNGWREVDREPMRDQASGRPLDFIGAPRPARLGVWPRGISRVAEVSAYAGALVAQHALTIYDRFSARADWRPFFDLARGQRNRLLGLPPDDAPPPSFVRDYDIVRLGDLISLVFCNAWDEPVETRGYRIAVVASNVVISPDPFGGATVALSVSARVVPDCAYESDAALAEAFRNAEVIEVRGSAAGG